VSAEQLLDLHADTAVSFANFSNLTMVHVDMEDDRGHAFVNRGQPAALYIG
jgi:hypothetical protein